MRRGIKTEWVIWAISGAVFAWLFAGHPAPRPCTWVRAHDKENGESLWLNLAATGSLQINERDEGIAHGTAAWSAMNHLTVVKESPDELMAECR